MTSPHGHSPQAEGAATATFGFRTVAEADKAALVGAVFDAVAPRYDLMNDLMSLGVHRFWKDAMIDAVAPRPDMHLLDVGGGTGDIAFRFLRRGGGGATIADINTEMLNVGRDRAIDRGMLDGLDWLAADAEALPIADASVDAYTTAFCLRNVTRMDAALAEARRVLKPGGRFLCLEFSRCALPALAPLYDAWSFRVLPALGARIAGNADAYRYLAESIRRFPDAETFATSITDAGFGRTRWRTLSGGIAALHSAWRL